MTTIAAFVLFLALGGCTTFEDSKSKGASAQVTVHREPSSRDSFFPMRFSVDGRPVAVLYPDDERNLEVAAGERRFTFELGVYSCAADVRLESGKSYSYRLARGCVIELDEGNSDSAEDQIRDTEHQIGQ